MAQTQTVKPSLASWTNQVPESEIRRLLKYHPKYYFAGGQPGNLPLKQLKAVISTIMSDSAFSQEIGNSELFNYGPSDGLLRLKQTLSNRMKQREDVMSTPGDMLITSGSQQSLNAIIQVLLNPGDTVVISQPTYLGFLGPAMINQTNFISVPQDQEGIIPEGLEYACNFAQETGKPVKLLYVNSFADNPGGISHSLKRKQELYNLAEQYNFYILEDNAYKEISFDGMVHKPIKSFDVENERVIYSCTTSKEMAVIRLGYSVLPNDLISQLVKLKGYQDLCTSTFLQEIAYQYYEHHIDTSIGKIVKEYEKQANAMKHAIDQYLPGHRTDPNGGFFIWHTLDEKINTKEFLEIALENDILYVPGYSFYPVTGKMVNQTCDKIEYTSQPTNSMRLCYSTLKPNLIHDGIEKLGKLLS